MQYTEQHAWIPAFAIHYHLAVDGISVPLILLTTFSTLLVALLVPPTDRPAPASGRLSGAGGFDERGVCSP